MSHHVFRELPGLVDALTVVNDTRVVPARIAIDSPRGEVLLLERVDGDVWEALARPTRRLHAGRRYGTGGQNTVELLEHLGEGRWRVRLDGEPDGVAPLPPYITEPLADAERYQTVFARDPGSAAAPTAGLHFTPELIQRLTDREIRLVTLVLHVGLDTFRPVTEADPRTHAIHREWYALSPEVVQAVEHTRSNGGRIVAVGTTSVRALESWAAREACRLATDSDLEALDTLVTEMERSSEVADIDRLSGSDVTFHRRICEIAGNHRLLRVWTGNLGQIRLLSRQVIGTLYADLHQVPRRHEQILEALRQRTPDLAETLVREHIESVAARISARMADAERNPREVKS